MVLLLLCAFLLAICGICLPFLKPIFIVNTLPYGCESKLLTSTNKKKANCIEHIRIDKMSVHVLTVKWT